MREEFKIALEAKRKIDREGTAKENLNVAVKALLDLFEACKDVDVALVIMPQLDAEVKKLKDTVTNELIQRNFDTMMHEIIEELEKEGWE